jgi:hypothetical protein
MHLDIEGGTEQQQQFVTSIAKFSADKLLTDRMNASLGVVIELTDNMLEEEGVQADCTWEDDPNRPKDFTIRIDSSLKLRQLLESVAHEMVHVKQYATGQMREYLTDVDRCRFEDKEYSRKNTDYYDFPWEIEAYGREVGLFIRWAEKEGYAAEPWAKV